MLGTLPPVALSTTVDFCMWGAALWMRYKHSLGLWHAQNDQKTHASIDDVMLGESAHYNVSLTSSKLLIASDPTLVVSRNRERKKWMIKIDRGGWDGEGWKVPGDCG